MLNAAGWMSGTGKLPNSMALLKKRQETKPHDRLRQSSRCRGCKALAPILLSDNSRDTLTHLIQKIATVIWSFRIRELQTCTILSIEARFQQVDVV